MIQPWVTEVAQLPGIFGLPANVRLHFTRALIAEMEGDTETAEAELNRAVEAEEALSTPAL